MKGFYIRFKPFTRKTFSRQFLQSDLYEPHDDNGSFWVEKQPDVSSIGYGVKTAFEASYTPLGHNCAFLNGGKRNCDREYYIIAFIRRTILDHWIAISAQSAARLWRK